MDLCHCCMYEKRTSFLSAPWIYVMTIPSTITIHHCLRSTPWDSRCLKSLSFGYTEKNIRNRDEAATIVILGENCLGQKQMEGCWELSSIKKKQHHNYIFQLVLTVSHNCIACMYTLKFIQISFPLGVLTYQVNI